MQKLCFIFEFVKFFIALYKYFSIFNELNVTKYLFNYNKNYSVLVNWIIIIIKTEKYLKSKLNFIKILNCLLTEKIF